MTLDDIYKFLVISLLAMMNLGGLVIMVIYASHLWSIWKAR